MEKLRKCKFTQTERSATFEDDAGVQWTPVDPKHEPHQALKKALEKLSPHYKAILGIQGKDYQVKGFTLHNYDPDAGVKINGVVTNNFNEAMSLVSPLRKFADVELYPDMDDLQKCLAKVEKEVHAYFYKQKYADADQMQIAS
jgi:hypothetical protein